MKKLLLAVCFVLGATAISFAQGGGVGNGRQRRSPEDAAKQLQTQLKLTDDQTAKAKDIYTVQAAKFDSVMKAANGDGAGTRGGMRPIQEATRAKITALLTDEQKAAWKKIQEEQAARRSQRGGGQGGPGDSTTHPLD